MPKGMDLVRPEAGFAIKTRLEKAGDKVFLNVVHSDKIGKPASKPTTDANGRSGVSWSLPHSVGQPRMEADRSSSRLRGHHALCPRPLIPPLAAQRARSA